MLPVLTNRAFLLFMYGVLLLPLTAYAGSMADLIEEGNIAYSAGEYKKALSAYEEASVEAPESPVIYFNKGGSLYQMGDYAAATDAFEKAALKTKDSRLEAKSRFNLGNCSFREAERQQDSDLNKALEALTKSIQHYQGALKLAPEFREAAENIEVARLMMKNILDAVNKQKEAAQQQQEAMGQAAKKIEELIERQQQALDRNQQLDDERRAKGDSEALRKQVQDLAKEQRDLQTETEEQTKNMPKPAGQPSLSEGTPAEKHLKNAEKEQNAAAEHLEENHTSEAEPNQEKALKELKEALESLQGDQDSVGQQEEQQQGNQQGREGVSPQEGPQAQGEQQEEQAVEAQFMEDAHDILDEEKDNRAQRQMQAAGAYKDVDKDW
ncbi:MAG: tetratricopeptide repeat protein [Deltaproteobacteria bacterium]|nr:tetratricopeptide repeat protein [Deltaproteobacteria bacterium]